MRARPSPLAGLVLISLSCSGATPAFVPLPPLPRAETRATLVGPRCAGGDQCECRVIGASGDEPHPGERFKRFEVRVGPTQHELWVSVDDMVLYKSRERATECFYLDLVPGKHPVRIHGKRDQGVGVVVAINELSAGGPWWYPAFELDCGGGGPCDLDSMRAEQARIQAVPRGIHAPCGSVKIQRFQWQTGTMPDALHPGEIVVDFFLDVYQFATSKQPGSDDCARRGE